MRAFLFILPAVLFVAGGCWQKELPPRRATVALINDEAITVEELLALLPEEDQREGSGKKNVVKDKEREVLQRGLLEQLIEKRMLLQEARRLNIQLTEAEFEEKSAVFRNGMDEAAFSRFLADQNISRDSWEKATRENLLVEKLRAQLAEEKLDKELSVSPEEVRDYYESHLKEWQVDEQLKLRQIVVGTEEKAAAIRLSLLKGADFLETAKIHSQQVHVEDGEGLGYLSRSEVPVGFDPLFKAEIGSISEVIRTQFGYHLVMVEDRRSARTLSFEETKKKIYQALLDHKREQAFSQWLKKLRRHTEVRINEELLKKFS